MHYAVGGTIICVLLILRMIPYLLSLIIIMPEKRNQVNELYRVIVKIKYLVTVVLNFAFYFIMHKLLMHRFNFVATIKRILALQFSYQDIDYFPVSLIITTIVAIVLGMIVGGQYNLLKVHKSKIILITSVQLFACIILFYIGFSGLNNLAINEIETHKNFSVDDVCYGEYIELYNKGFLACSVYKVYISDDRNNLKKYEIPANYLESNSYMLIYMADADISLSNAGGQEIILSDERGNIIDSVTTEALSDDQVYSRKVDGIGEWIVSNATPAFANAGSYFIKDNVVPPSLSYKAGFYDSPILLELSASENEKIYYTLDGSIPTEESICYEEPIYVYDRSNEENQILSVSGVTSNLESVETTPRDKAFIVRAISVDSDGCHSDVVTATYFINKSKYEAGGVLSIVADPEALVGDEGIYVVGTEYREWYLNGQNGDEPKPNFNKRGKDYEVPASFEYITSELEFSQDIGLRVNGGSSRNRIVKSLAFYARNEYSGKTVFDENIFDGIESHKIGTRGGYANSVCQMMARKGNRDVATQQVKRIALFLNGEFLCNTNVIEKYDARYFEEHYGLLKDNVVIFNNGGMTEGTEEDASSLNEIYDFINNNDLSSEEAYQKFGDIVDLQSYMDYMAIRIYICDMDFTEAKNSVMWKTKIKTSNPYEDGKWRWGLYDLDCMEWPDADMWGCEKKAELNAFNLEPRYASVVDQQPIFVALKENEQFKKDFVNTFMDLVNTIFTYENAMSCIYEYGTDTTDYQPGNGGTQSFEYYEDFFKNRAQYAVKYLGEEFSLTGKLEPVSIDVNNYNYGSVQLNTITIDNSNGEWTGDYYTDFSVTISAVPKEGYSFVKWNINGEECYDKSLNIEIKEGGCNIYAVFEKQ